MEEERERERERREILVGKRRARKVASTESKEGAGNEEDNDRKGFMNASREKIEFWNFWF